MADRPRLLLVPEFTELEWAIRPHVEEWAEVASYDIPGVGDEPRPEVMPEPLTRDVVVDRGLEEIERRGWERFFVVGDGLGLGGAVRIADARKDSLLGLALGHARLSYRTEGDRAPLNGEVMAAMSKLVEQDRAAFIRYAIPQVTHGSVDEELAQRMVDRFPEEMIGPGWEMATRDDVPIREVLEGIECPMLFAKHDGCLVSTDEGFEDAVSAFPEARKVIVPDAPAGSEEFAEALRSFCLETLRDASPNPAREPGGAPRTPRS
jgi:pimeloyl-ACP methyl ester carboxylesterase